MKGFHFVYRINDIETNQLIYIGQTGDLKDRFSDHHKKKCFSENDPNCLCVLIEKDKETRLSIESDLMTLSFRSELLNIVNLSLEYLATPSPFVPIHKHLPGSSRIEVTELLTNPCPSYFEKVIKLIPSNRTRPLNVPIHI